MVISTILSVTVTEVTIKGIVSLFLAGFAIFLALFSRTGSVQPKRFLAQPASKSWLNEFRTTTSRQITRLRLIVGSVCAGAIIALVVAVALSFAVTQFLSRLG